MASRYKSTNYSYNKRRKKTRSLYLILYLVQELFEKFVSEDFVKDLDFSSLDNIGKSFITDEFKEKESDMIWKIKFKGKDMYIFILMEFQSTVDKFMSLRMLRYVTEFYEFLMIQKPKPKKLSAVFPLLLYNGDAAWTAPFRIEDLIDYSIPSQFIPQFSYYSIIEKAIPREKLLSIKSVISAIFFVETTTSVEEIRKNIKKIVDLLPTDHKDIVILFVQWFRNYFENDEGVVSGEISNLEEVENMLSSAVEKYKEKAEKRGEIRGVKKGEKKKEIEIIITMHTLGHSINNIVAVTKLSKKEVEGIIKIDY